MRIAASAVDPIDCGFFRLPVAIRELTDVVNLHRHAAWDQAMLLSVTAAQAVAKEHVDVAEALLNLDVAWIAKINDCAFD